MTRISRVSRSKRLSQICGKANSTQHVADAFIRQTRFDPRRKAATEQELYDALPRALESLAAHTECNLEVAGYRARVTRAEVAGIGARFVAAAREAVGGAYGEIVADPLLALLPGLADAFPRVRFLAREAPLHAVEAHGERLVNREGPLSFVGTLPCLARGEPQPEVIVPTPIPAAPSLRHPTHLLEGATARALVASGTDLPGGVRLHRSEAGWTLQGRAGVNGEPADDGRLLQAGDVVTAANTEFRLIEVVDDGS